MVSGRTIPNGDSVKQRALAKKESVRPRVAGLGLVALDIVIREGAAPQYSAGGTCGNVLAILAALGWRALPIARLAPDRASTIVSDDLKRWGVDISFLRVSPVSSSPIIVERLHEDIDGIPYHRFSFFCPGCNRRCPSFQPVLLRSIQDIFSKIGGYDVLFIDRASPSSVLLARHAKEAGTTVFFEPPSANDEDRNFRAMLELATIVKYSHDRIDELEIPNGSVKLEIQTLGRGGLRFRSTLASLRNKWLHLDAEPKSDLVDTAGAGDWLSAGMIFSLGSGGWGPLAKVSRRRLLNAVSFGQSLAAWSCGFVGARGGMYGRGFEELQGLANEAAISRTSDIADYRLRPEATDQAQVCDSCDLHHEKLPA
jgi:sugar/nucleoside kinase (ribokinase family)